MSNNNLFIVVGISILAVVIVIIYNYLNHKNINMISILNKIKLVFMKSEVYTEAAGNLTSGKLQEILKSSEALEKLAAAAIGYAEQLFLSLQITDDADGFKRKNAALKYVYSFLESQGIKVTDDVKIIVNGVIENTIFSDKTIDEINAKVDKLVSDKLSTIQKQNDELMSEKLELQEEVNKHQQKLQEVTQKLNSVKNFID